MFSQNEVKIPSVIVKLQLEMDRFKLNTTRPNRAQ